MRSSIMLRNYVLTTYYLIALQNSIVIQLYNYSNHQIKAVGWFRSEPTHLLAYPMHSLA